MKRTYIVSVEIANSNNFTDDKNDADNSIEFNPNSAEACYNIIKEEYEHSCIRSDKLDNKVYIALTFCAFIFLSVMELMSSVIKFKYPKNIQEFTLLSIYIVVCVLAIGIFLHTLIKFANLLKPMKIKRINVDFYTENELQLYDPFTIYTFTCEKYRESIDASIMELENRFKQYNKCISNLVLIVICLFILSTLKLFIPT